MREMRISGKLMKNSFIVFKRLKHLPKLPLKLFSKKRNLKSLPSVQNLKPKKLIFLSGETINKS